MARPTPLTPEQLAEKQRQWKREWYYRKINAEDGRNQWNKKTCEYMKAYRLRRKEQFHQEQN
jgi:hypothetical protein